MKLSTEIASLYQLLSDQLLATFSEEKIFIESFLKNSSIKRGFEQRLRYVELVGIIKFIYKQPIFAPKIEKRILEEIKVQSIEYNLNPEFAACCFQIVMDYSKTTQTQLDNLLNQNQSLSLKLLNEKIISLTNDGFETSDHLLILLNSTKPFQDKLNCCRRLIQIVTDDILKTMMEIQIQNKLANIK